MPEPCAHEHLAPVRTALLCGLAGGMLSVAIQLPFLGRYGWDRDELYFLSAARRPALGYVDFPPLTAWIGWVVHAVAGNSLDALRLTCLAAGVGVIVLVALMVRELGGGWRAQLAAAVGWALMPVALGSASIFHPTWFDQLAWAAFLYVALRILGRPEPRLWPVLGLVAGIGLEAKYTIAVLLVAFTIGLLLTPSRRLLARRGPWLALGVALLVFLPNLVWQAEHGWPSVHFASSQNSKTAADTSRAAYLVQGVAFLGLAGAVVAVVGIVWLWRRRRLRPLAIVPVAVTLLFLVERGRSYYPLPGDTIAFAAGIVSIGGWLRAGSRVRWAAVGALVLAQLAVLAVAAPLVLPVRSTASMVRAGIWKNTFYKDELGWPELADQTAQAWRGLPAAERRGRRRPREQLRRGLGARALRARARAAARPQRPPLAGSTGARSASTSASRSSSATTPASSPRSAARFGRSRTSTTAGTSPTRSGGGRSTPAPCGARSASSGSPTSPATSSSYTSIRPRPKASMRPHRPGMSSSSRWPMPAREGRVDDQVVADAARGRASSAAGAAARRSTTPAGCRPSGTGRDTWSSSRG